MTGTKQPAQILLTTTEIRRSVSITNTLKAETENLAEPTIQPTIIHCDRETGTGHSDRNHLLIGILNSGIDVPISGWNIDNHTGMNPHGLIVTTIPESNISNNCYIFDSVRRTSDIAYMGLEWNYTIKRK